jgi:alpha-glucosidase
LSPDAATRNVEWQRDDARSLLTLYRRLLRLRRDHAALSIGEFRRLPISTDFVFAYERHDGDATLRILLNFSASPQTVNFTAGNDGSWAILLSTHTDRPDSRSESDVVLAANEGLILFQNSVGT